MGQSQKQLISVKIVKPASEEKKGPLYKTLTGKVEMVAPPEPEQPEEPAIKVMGYSLEDIEQYFENFLNGTPTKSKKETKFRNVVSKFFEDKGNMVAKGKSRTLGAFMKSDEKTLTIRPNTNFKSIGLFLMLMVVFWIYPIVQLNSGTITSLGWILGVGGLFVLLYFIYLVVKKQDFYTTFMTKITAKPNS